MKERLTKRQQEKLTEAAEKLENAAADAFAALWYFERDSFKGWQWAYAAKAKAAAASKILNKLLPEKAR